MVCFGWGTKKSKEESGSLIVIAILMKDLFSLPVDVSQE